MNRRLPPPDDSWSTAVGPVDCVSRERQVRLAGASPAGARARRPVAWIAGWRETETLKPIDKAIERMVSESPGRNASEREVAPKDPNPGGRAVDYPAKATPAVAVWLTRRPAPAGLGATARCPSRIEQLEKPSSSRCEISGVRSDV